MALLFSSIFIFHQLNKIKCLDMLFWCNATVFFNGNCLPYEVLLLQYVCQYMLVVKY